MNPQMPKVSYLAVAFLSLNAFILAVALPILLMSEEGRADSRSAPDRILVVPIGGVAPPAGFPGDFAAGLEASLAEGIRSLGLGEALPAERVRSQLPAGPFEPRLEAALQVASREGATHLLRLRIEDHLRLDPGTVAIALSAELRKVDEGGRLIWSGKSVRSIQEDAPAARAAQLEAMKILGLAFAPGGIRTPGFPAPDPTPIGSLVSQLPSPTPRTFPEVAYTGSSHPRDSYASTVAGRTDARPITDVTRPPVTPPPDRVGETLPPVRPQPPLATPREPLPIVPSPPPAVPTPVPPPTPAATPAPSVTPAGTPVAPRTTPPRPAPEATRTPPSIDDRAARTVIGKIYFATGSAELDPAGLEAIATLAGRLDARPELTVLVEGHADPRGGEQENYVLSRRRAETVKDALLEAGMGGPERVVACGHSELVPAAQGSDPTSLARNRRVEVSVLGKAAGAAVVARLADARAQGPRLAAEVEPAGLPPVVRPARPVAAPSSPEARRIRELLDARRRKADPDAAAPQAEAEAPAPEDDMIRPGDALSVVVQGRAELTRTVTVDPRGEIAFPLIDSVPLAGVSLEDGEARLTEALAKFVVKPTVQLSRVYVLKIFGQVTNQGVFQFDARPNLVELVARAGGLPRSGETANPASMHMGRYIARVLSSSKGNEIHDLSRMLEVGDAGKPVTLPHGATVIVEWNRFEEITVVGKIQTTVIYRPGMRLLEALALAGGVSDEKTQNIKSVRVLRRLPDGKIQRLDVNLHDLIHRGQVNRDIALEPGDYIVVPKRSDRHTLLTTLRDLLQPIVQVGLLGTVF